MTKPHLNLVFDLKRLKQLKLNAVKMRQKDNFYIELIEKELITRLQFTKRDFKNIFIYGEFSDNFLQFLKHQYPNRTSIMTASFIPSSSPLLTYFPFTVCSEEYLPFPSQTFDLVISCASFHHLNNIPKALAE